MKLDLFELNGLPEAAVRERIASLDTTIKHGNFEPVVLREYAKELKALVWALSKYSE